MFLTYEVFVVAVVVVFAVFAVVFDVNVVVVVDGTFTIMSYNYVDLLLLVLDKGTDNLLLTMLHGFTCYMLLKMPLHVLKSHNAIPLCNHKKDANIL